MRYDRPDTLPEYRERGTVRAFQAVERIEFAVGCVTFMARPGEWIVWSGALDRDGIEIPWVAPDGVFRDLYEVTK